MYRWKYDSETFDYWIIDQLDNKVLGPIDTADGADEVLKYLNAEVTALFDCCEGTFSRHFKKLTRIQAGKKRIISNVKVNRLIDISDDEALKLWELITLMTEGAYSGLVDISEWGEERLQNKITKVLDLIPHRETWEVS